MTPYPADPAARDRFVLDRRPPRASHDPWRAQGLLVEDERTAGGTVERVATVLLTGRECRWRCVMCDLWRYTTEGDTPRGAIASQVADARRTLDESGESVRQLKLYNASSFFDPLAVPVEDYEAVAGNVAGLSRVIVESHPSLVGERTRRFLDALACHPSSPALEVAMGLETANPAALERLHKRMTVAGFLHAADRLAALGVALRVFVLVSPPFVPAAAQDDWLCRSIDVAFAAGATVVSLIPTRGGNGALESLAEEGFFRTPRLHDLERSLALALERAPVGGRVFADLWDLPRFADCPHCLDERRARLHAANIEQRDPLPVPCPHCRPSPHSRAS
jgi:archaeosine synthase beta-subunit